MIENYTPERSRYNRPDELDPRGSTDENARQQPPTGREDQTDRSRSAPPPAMRPQEERMTNEELAQRIKAGEKDLVGELWNQTERLLKYMIDRELVSTDKAERAEAAGVTREDLLQESYFALLQAVEAYDPESGFAFSSFLKWPLKNVVNRAIGIKTQKDREAPLSSAASLDAPIANDSEDTYAQVLADPSDPIGDLTDQIFRESMHEDLEKSLAELSDREAEVIRAKYYDDQTIEQIGARVGCSGERARQIEEEALEALRMKTKLQEYRDEIISHYAYRGSFRKWKDTRESSVEIAAIKLAEMEERAEKLDRWASLRTL